MGGGERLIKGREIEMKAERERERERERGGGGGWGALNSEAQHDNEVVFC